MFPNACKNLCYFLACAIMIAVFLYSTEYIKCSTDNSTTTRSKVVENPRVATAMVEKSLVDNSGWSYGYYNISAQKPMRGAPFDEKWLSYLKAFKLSDEDIAKTNDDAILKSRPVFVTAFSSNHVKDAKDNVLSSFANHFAADANNILVVYDLGLAEHERQTIQDTYKFVHLKRFNFTAYPPHVKLITNYRWKPLIVAEVQRDYNGSAWWMDSICEWQSNDTGDFFQKVKSGRVYPHMSVYGHTVHSVLAATNPMMYKYLPIERVSSIEMMVGATCQVSFATSDVKQHVLKWWVLCALQQDCMSFKEERMCRFQKSRYTQHAGCHRYDQSALSILLGNRNQFKLPLYYTNELPMTRGI